MEIEKRASIQISKKTREGIKRCARKSESYEAFLKRIMAELFGESWNGDGVQVIGNDPRL